MYAKDFASARSYRYRSIPRYVGPPYRAQRLLVPKVSEVFARDCSTFWNNNAGGLAVIRQDDRDADGRFRVPFFVPTQFDHVSFSNLPTSLNLRAALRKI